MRLLLVISTAILLGPVCAFSAVFTETTPTGSTLNTAVVVPSDTTTIQGSLSPSNHIDLYRIQLLSEGFYTIFANSGAFDTNLHLFNADGNPLGANDDIDAVNGNFNSALAFDLLPGIYFIGVAVNNSFGLDAQGNVISDNDFGVLNPSGVLASWDVEISEAAGAYEILIVGSSSAGRPESSPVESIPEPGTFALAATTIAVLARLRSTKKV